MKSENIPHYTDPTTIKSKYSKAVARFADFVWWLFKHRNYVVNIGLGAHKGLTNGLGGTTLLRSELPTLQDVIAKCKATVESRCPYKDGWTLDRVYVNGGNGEDRPGIPIYTVDVVAD